MHVVIRTAPVAAVLWFSAVTVAQPGGTGPDVGAPAGQPSPSGTLPGAPAPGYPVPSAPGYFPEPAPLFPPPPESGNTPQLPPGYPPPGYPPPGYPVQPAPVYPPPSGAYPAYPPYGYGAPYPPPVELASMPPASPPPGYHEHDGLFVHFLLGGGYASNKTPAGAVVSGGAIATSLDVGLAVARNLVLHAGAGITVMPSAGIESGGAVVSNTMSSNARELDFYQLMFGATYYMTSRNFFASLRTGAGEYTLGNASATKQSRSNWGWLVRGGLGKEWWVGPNWGLGGEAMVCYSRAGGERPGGLRALGGPMFGLAAVATYQ